MFYSSKRPKTDKACAKYVFHIFQNLLIVVGLFYGPYQVLLFVSMTYEQTSNARIILLSHDYIAYLKKKKLIKALDRMADSLTPGPEYIAYLKKKQRLKMFDDLVIIGFGEIAFLKKQQQLKMYAGYLFQVKRLLKQVQFRCRKRCPLLLVYQLGQTSPSITISSTSISVEASLNIDKKCCMIKSTISRSPKLLIDVFDGDKWMHSLVSSLLRWW